MIKHTSVITILAILTGIISALLSGVNSNLTMLESVSVGLFLFFIIHFINSFGQKIALSEFFLVFAAFFWLITPILFYHIYNKNNYLSNLWIKYMEVPTDTYYSFVLPGFIMMSVGMLWPIAPPPRLTKWQNIIGILKNYLKGKSRVGWILLATGIVSGPLSLFAPEVFRNVAFLLSTLVYPGLFYLYFSDFKYKKVIWAIFFVYTGTASLSSGMFGSELFILLISIMILSVEWKLRFITKLSLVFCLASLIFLLQSIKGDYRKISYSSSGGGASDFGRLFSERVKNTDELFTGDEFFFVILRFNEGWQIARTMDRVPRQFDYAYGETILNTFIATLVPRFLWPDKPKSGGKANLERFWGESYGRTSMNISPIGEAYANFGIIGGICFMFFFGLAMNWLIVAAFRWVDRTPSILCWFPVLFMGFFGVETDILSIFNSFVKSVIFIALFLRIYRALTDVNI